MARAEFARLMAACGPFEPRPLLAVAVSGGADSMALALMAAGWARARRGRVVALTVDHRLRTESRAEARQVARWMRVHGVAHRILAWRGARPRSGIQAAARTARYGLLEAACRAEGALHLLLGHTRGDQAETVLLRLEAGSGPLGLAAMPAVTETAALRLVRPLLGVPRQRLEATLRACGQDWIDDPSNRDARYARVRVRGAVAAATEPEAFGAAVAASAAALGRYRAAEERAVAALLVRAVAFAPEGHAWLDPASLAAAPPRHGQAALGALLATVGGLDHPPRREALHAFHEALIAGRLGGGRTLARCRAIPSGARLLVVRETRGIERIRPEHARAAWDGRFVIALSARQRAGTTIGALGAAGWAEAVAAAPWLRKSPLPYPARLALPALFDRHGVTAIPALGYARGAGPGRKKTPFARLLPKRALAAAFFAAWPAGGGPLEPRRPGVV